MKATIMKIDNGKMFTLAAPSMPKEYAELLNGLPVGMNQGSCGTAAFLKQKILAENVFESDYWKDHLDVPAKYGFASCWSQPVFNAADEVVATFALYYKEPRQPSVAETYTIDRSQRLLSIVLSNFNYWETVKKSKERFEQINRATKDAIYEWDIEQDRLMFGEGYTRSFGYQTDTDHGTPVSDWANKLHPSEKAAVVDELHAFLQDANKTRWEKSYRFLKQDGNFAYVEEIGQAIRDENGKAIRMVGVMRDNTETKELQKMLDEASQIAKVGGWELDLVKQLLHWSPVTYEIHEVSADFKPHLEQSIAFYRQDFREYVRQQVNQTIETGHPFDFEVPLITGEGNEKWVRAIGNGEFIDGVCIRIYGSLQDIHERKLLEERIQDISNNIPGVLFKYQINTNGSDQFTYVSEGANIVWGLSPSACMQNANLIWAGIRGGGDFDTVYASLRGSAKTLSIWKTSHKFLRPDGSMCYVEGYGRPKKSADGSIQWNCVLMDITAQKALEELATRTSKLANIGSWEINLQNPDNSEMYWSDMTRTILEIDQYATATLESAIEFAQPHAKPIIEAAFRELIERGIEFDIEIPIATNYRVKWVRLMGKSDRVNNRCIRAYGSIQDIHVRKTYELELAQKNHLLNNLSKVIGGLLHAEEWNQVLPVMLALVGKAASVDRVYYFELHMRNNRQLVANQRFEWAKETVHPEIDNYKLQAVPVSDYPEFFDPIIEGKPFQAITSQLPPSNFRNLLEEQSILSCLALPVMVGSTCWGLIGFDDCDRERFWSDSEVNFLSNVTTSLAAAIQRHNNRLQLETALFERNSILESIGDGFCSVNQFGIITYWNRQAEMIFNLERNQVEGKNVLEVFGKVLEISDFNLYHQLLSSKEKKSIEYHHPRTNNWFDLLLYPSGTGLSLFIRDISIRKQAEAQIRQSNERFEIITRATNDAIWDYDVEKDKLFWGQGFQALFGYNLKMINPSFQFLISRIHPEDRSWVLERIQEYMSGARTTSVWEEEYRFLKADGNYAYVVDKAVFIKNEQNRVVRALGAMSDISQRKEFEVSLKTLNEELEKNIKELAVSNQELEQFAYVASHDLQEPLRMVSGFLTQLEKKYSSNLDERALQYIHFATDGAKRMRQIILDLLDFSRVGKHKEKLTVVNVNQLVEETIVLHRNLIEEKQAEIRYEKLPVIISYRSPLLQVIQNLLVNALKYSKADGIPKITISAIDKDVNWTLVIDDNGIGIPQEYHDRIFIIFQRLHKRTEYSGTGIGLAIVKKIVDNLGGRIRVESEPGVGSTFYVTLPKIAPDEENKSTL